MNFYLVEDKRVNAHFSLYKYKIARSKLIFSNITLLLSKNIVQQYCFFIFNNTKYVHSYVLIFLLHIVICIRLGGKKEMTSMSFHVAYS